MSQKLKKILQDVTQSSDRITILTGAGISAESGIPTFRGPEGYWTVGSKAYNPQEMATYRMLMQYPDEVWKWYLYRIGVCGKAEPNSGHFALVEIEKLFKNRFILITQILNLASKSERGVFIKQPSSRALPHILQLVKEMA